jgi:peptidoglycan/LPS O-acetylase OafA/YrhL
MGYAEAAVTGARAYFERRLRRIVPLYLATMAAYMFLVNPDVLRLAWMPVWHILSHLGFRAQPVARDAWQHQLTRTGRWGWRCSSTC